MPNRIIKESVCTSETVDKMSWFEEVFFYRLIVNCDDFGRFDARPAVLKARLFPLKERLTLKEVSNALSRLAEIGIVRLYECDGKPYLFLPTWKVHQSPRAAKSKYPAPEDGIMQDEITCKQLHADDFNCKHMQADVPDIREREREPINDIREPRADISAEPGEPPAAPVILLPLNDGTDYPVSREQCREWSKLYPAVDVEQQLRGMRGWLLSNPAKRKTLRGVNKFINAWLAKEQDRGGSRRNAGTQRMEPPSDDDYDIMKILGMK